MKSRLHKLPAIGSLLAAVLFALEAAHSAPSEKPAAETTAAEGSGIPQSVFVVPASKAEGRDPFFPNSIRTDKVVIITKATNAPVDLAYNGMSGSSDRKFAIINYKTIAEGETAEVPTKAGRVQVHVIEVKEDSVTVEVNGVRKVIPYLGK